MTTRAEPHAFAQPPLPAHLQPTRSSSQPPSQQNAPTQYQSASQPASAYTTPPNSQGHSAQSAGFHPTAQQQHQHPPPPSYHSGHNPYPQTPSPNSPVSAHQHHPYASHHGTQSAHDLPSLPLAQRKPRPTKTMFIPAALRPTDRPMRAQHPITPPQSVHGSSDSLDKKGRFSRPGSRRGSRHMYPSSAVTSGHQHTQSESYKPTSSDTSKAAWYNYNTHTHHRPSSSSTAASHNSNPPHGSTSDPLSHFSESDLNLALTSTIIPLPTPNPGPPTRAHWRPDSSTSTCSYSSCNKPFTRLWGGERRHHCRRCGGLYCQEHSCWSVPLDGKAEFDPRVQDRVRCCAVCVGEYVSWVGHRIERAKQITTSRNTTHTETHAAGGEAEGQENEARKKRRLTNENNTDQDMHDARTPSTTPNSPSASSSSSSDADDADDDEPQRSRHKASTTTTTAVAGSVTAGHDYWSTF